MEAARKTMIGSWVWTVSILLFFFNFVFPEGLTLTLLLTPVWLFLLYQWRVNFRLWLGVSLVLLLLYAVVHFLHGVVIRYYVVSATILVATLIFGGFFYHALKRYTGLLDGLFRQVLILNFVLTILAVVLLFVPAVKDTLWYTISISQNIEPLPRLKLFTGEASHYSFLLAPVAIYFLARLLLCNVTQPALTLLCVFLPLALSFSLGVLACLFTSGLAFMLFYFRQIFQSASRRRMLQFMFAGCLVVIAILYLVYPENPLFHRITNVIQNKDTSARGRTYESFILADKILALKSYWFGAGPGQLKVLGRAIIIQYYQYVNMPAVIRIPNACAETLVWFGYAGLFFRLALQLLLFWYTKVAANPFRLWLFSFLFLYQFTGSYITNPSEYMLWALAFAPVFPDFIAGKPLAQNKT
jgi:hypothetical protein